MKNSTILIVVGKDTPTRNLGKKLEAIHAIPARASILVVGAVPVFPYYAVGVPPYGMTDVPLDWQNEMAESKAAMRAKVDEIEVLLAQHGVSGDVATVASDASQVASAISQRAMFCDLVLISEDLRDSNDLFKQAVHGVLFRSPVGVLLNDTQANALGSAKRVFVAWNTQIHSARAVHQALPILRQAKEVIVATIDAHIPEDGNGEDPGVDIAAWLTHHGCHVVVQQYESGKLDIGETILAKAKDAEADLIVMGAYGHSRTRETLFGGTSRTLIAQTEQPVFLVY